ncbi:TetR/AcrR family transcriptional regulator [Poseidonocella pacifica]|uniref:TetR/AcrR family transcriptional regulator n=1 Tax=Poseidonocella pacifica TaxID=871651 RepID=UPI0031839C28
MTRRKILTAGQDLVRRHGFGAVGLSRILSESGVPKGSFYYYFSSKEAFGQALLQDYVDQYLLRIDALFDGPGSAGDRLLKFWSAWLAEGRTEGIAQQCLVVKLGAEVADLSEGMRHTLDEGVSQLLRRVSAVLAQGVDDGSIRRFDDPDATARMLYAKWLGAAILVKLSGEQTPLQQALADTVHALSPENKL